MISVDGPAFGCCCNSQPAIPCREATSGEDACQMFAELAPDVVLMTSECLEWAARGPCAASAARDRRERVLDPFLRTMTRCTRAGRPARRARWRSSEAQRSGPGAMAIAEQGPPAEIYIDPSLRAEARDGGNRRGRPLP